MESKFLFFWSVFMGEKNTKHVIKHVLNPFKKRVFNEFCLHTFFAHCVSSKRQNGIHVYFFCRVQPGVARVWGHHLTEAARL